MDWACTRDLGLWGLSFYYDNTLHWTKMYGQSRLPLFNSKTKWILWNNYPFHSQWKGFLVKGQTCFYCLCNVYFATFLLTFTIILVCGPTLTSIWTFVNQQNIHVLKVFEIIRKNHYEHQCLLNWNLLEYFPFIKHRKMLLLWDLLNLGFHQ